MVDPKIIQEQDDDALEQKIDRRQGTDIQHQAADTRRRFQERHAPAPFLSATSATKISSNVIGVSPSTSIPNAANWRPCLRSSISRSRAPSCCSTATPSIDGIAPPVVSRASSWT